MRGWVQREIERQGAATMYEPGTPAHESFALSRRNLGQEIACARDTDGDGNCGRRNCPYCVYRARQRAWAETQEAKRYARILDAFPFIGERLITGGFLGC